jgi:hypothetical protein
MCDPTTYMFVLTLKCLDSPNSFIVIACSSSAGIRYRDDTCHEAISALVFLGKKFWESGPKSKIAIVRVRD